MPISSNPKHLAELLPILNNIEAKLDEIIASKHGHHLEWMTVRDVAKLLGRAPFTVREWCRLSRICAERLPDKTYRIHRDEVARIQEYGLNPLRPSIDR